MPASARSLRITESYRTRMIGLRNRAKAEARRTWARVDPDRLDATFNPGMLVLMTAQLQREAARLSAGYLAAYVSSEKGEKVAPPMAMGLDVGKVWTGSSLTKAFRGAVIGTKIGIADGKEPVVAYKEGGKALVRTAGLAVDDVCRESLRVAMDQSPDVNGYVRAVKGTCEACLGAADGQPLEPGEVLDTHPNCQCVAEPTLRSTAQDKNQPQGDLGEWSTVYDDAVRAVDDVHKYPDDAVATTVRLDSKLRDASSAAFDSYKREIVLNPKATPDVRTLVHELGHKFDDDLAEFRMSYASKEARKAGTPAMKELVSALRGSAAYKRIGKTSAWEGAPKAQLSYWRSSHELFARAYAQWVSGRAKVPGSFEKWELEAGTQWEPEDFKPIAKAMEKLMREQGLLK